MTQLRPYLMTFTRALACIALLLLVGCGFHPRGELQLPPNLGPVKVQSADPYSALADSLARSLQRGGAVAADATDTKSATLRIAGEAFTSGPLSVDDRSHVREYVLSYVVSFEFTAADGVVLTPLQTIKLRRDYTYDDAHALGSAEEQGTLREEMQRDMAASILRSIGIALRNTTH